MLDFISYIRKRWSEISPSGGQKGTTVDEMAIKPTGIVLGDFYNKLVDIKNVNNIENWESMTDEELDDFGSKFFMDRIKGGISSTLIRVRFNVRSDIKFDDNIKAKSSDGTEFVPAISTFISGNSFVSSNDSLSYFYVDVPFVSSIKSITTNIPINSIVRLDGLNVPYVSVTNITPATGGSTRETNKEYYNRLIYLANDKSMMIKAGVYATIRKSFPAINSVYIAGAGDKYMDRDLLSANKKDSYINDFKGKIPANNSIKNFGASYVFPPIYKSSMSKYWGPFSSKTDYEHPLSIYPLVNGYDSKVNNDAAFFGYDILNELDIEEYSGLYYNDFSNTLNVKTDNLLDFNNENIPSGVNYSVTTPNSEWISGSHGKQNGNFGELYNGAINVVKFYDNKVELLSGAKNAISISKDVHKRTGVKNTGSFIFPNSDKIYGNSSLNFILSGVTDGDIDSFNGIGFGVMMLNNYVTGLNNAVMFFTHSSRYTASNLYVNQSDIDDNNVSIAGVNALKEKGFELSPGIKYDYEFIINDDLSLTVKISAQVNTSTKYEESMKLESNILKPFNGVDGINTISTKRYGQGFKVTLDSNVSEIDLKWEVSDIIVRDLNHVRATAMLSFDITNVKTGLEVFLRAYGRGYLSNGVVEGYTAYIWDLEATTNIPTIGNYSSGGWVIASDISNPNGERKSNTSLFKHTIRDINRYKVEEYNGDFIYIMVVASGSTFSNISYNNDYVSDTETELVIDYAKVEEMDSNYYHSNNMADVYVVTTRSAELPQYISATVPYNGFAELSSNSDIIAPINKIDSVIINSGTSYESVLTGEEITLYKDDNGKENSAYETSKLVLNTPFVSDTVVVNYIPFPDISSIQSEFEKGKHAKMYGDILIKHKYPVRLSFNIQLSSSRSFTSILNSIWNYIDNNNSGTFSTSELVRYLYSNNIASNIKEPITVSYERSKGDVYDITGNFTSSLSIRDIEYFEAGTITVEGF